MIDHFEEKKGNKYLVLNDERVENKKFQRNITKFGKVLKKKQKQLMVVKKLNMGKMKKKLGSDLMTIYY